MKHRPSVDALPEHMSYRDEGCDLYPSCLNCPLPKCRYDEPGWVHRAARATRHQKMVELYATTPLSINQLAAQLGVSSRTVHRALARRRVA